MQKTEDELAEPGLRERKREDTRKRLEVAAVEIALERGYESATVDAISEAANVSPRTFFNYFESKEDAILGVRDAGVPERIAALPVVTDDVIGSIIELFVAAFEPGVEGHELQKKRMALAKRYPDLLTRQLTQLGRVSDLLTVAVVARLTASGDYADRSETELRTDAEMLLSLCVGAFRIATKEWMAAGGRASIAELQQRALALVNDLRKRLK